MASTKCMDFYGHRGASAEAPENTLASLRLSRERGAVGAEFDLQLTRDNVLVLLHDDTLRRTGVPLRRLDDSSSDVDDELFDLPLSQVEWSTVKETVDVGGSFGEHYRGERLATFSEALEFLGAPSGDDADACDGAPREFEFLVEIKRGDIGSVHVAAQLVADVAAASPSAIDIGKQLTFISFSLDVVIACRAAIPSCRALYITEPLYDDEETPAQFRTRIDAALDAGASGVDLPADPRYVRRAPCRVVALGVPVLSSGRRSRQSPSPLSLSAIIVFPSVADKCSSSLALPAASWDHRAHTR
jgi:glycerophosphoryl diester phosphodiesterase